MRVLKIAGYTFMALALAGGWAFLYWQSSALDMGAIEQSRVALGGLRSIDARWNDQLVAGSIRTQPAAEAPRYRSAYSTLEVHALKLGSPEVGRALPGLKAALEEKGAIAGTLAATQADIAEAQRADPPDAAKVGELRAQAAALFEQAWLVSTAPRLELVSRAIDRAFDDALTQAELYRVGLLFYSGFLLTVMAFLVWSLFDSRRQIDRVNELLREANESLEARVKDRTRELSDALVRLKESEAMLVQSEKMSSLGQMVAGLVHEVNTPLAYVKASMEALKKRMPELARLATETEQLLALLSAEGADEAQLAAKFAAVRALLEDMRRRGAVEEIGRQVEDGVFGIGQISELVGSLKDFSRLDRSHLAQVDLHEGLESTLRIARHQLKARSVSKEYGKLARVSCSPSQINQVFLNLITNAAQATPETGGRITLRTSMRDAAHVAVEIADNGHGIPADVLPKIFDPFFTTKGVGKGTGLGLSICYKIIESHGGRLEVQSAPGQGTRFTVVLPISTQPRRPDMTPARIGRYEVTGELGRGGMAIVYRGVDSVIQRPAALKVVRKADLPADEAALVLERFKREAQAAGSLNHPNIVAIYEYGEDDEQAWIAMELVEGKPLREHLIEGWRPEITRLPSVIEDLLEALDYSHSRGVVHRDVKPGNVLVSGMGTAKISDFGIARIERSHITQEGEVLGTPYYMAPEQFDGKAADERTDIYAAGVIVYEVLCGRRPFTGQGGNLMRQILDTAPAPASTFEPKLPVSIDMVLGRALAKKPEGRYKSARDFLVALRNAFPGAAPAATTQPVRIPGNVGALRKALGAPPVAPSPVSEIAPTVAISRTPTKLPLALFVDDEERVVNALKSLFRDSFEVETATGGGQALERLAARRFHVLVSDQRMPEMPGVELLRQAKVLAPSTVRILLTGYSDLAAIVGSVNESEVFRFVSKPWAEEDLRATLTEAADVAIALEAAASRPAATLKTRGAVLVLGDAAIARGAREMARGAFPVHEAKDVEAALAILADVEIGALVCDLDSAGGDPAALLRVLKQQSPQTQLIATSASTDSETIISLINEARIYRFLKKPLNLSLLQSALATALDRYARMVRSPDLARGESAKKSRDSAAASSILGKLKALGKRFF